MSIPGYTYGTAEVAQSPVSLEELRLLEGAVAWTEEDARYLRMAGDVLEDQVEEILDLWYGFVGSTPQLVHYFSDPQGQPISSYLAAVRKRFGQWILDTCRRPRDREWLNYQHEIALRHHRTKKNRTDGVVSPDHIPLRYVIALVAPIALTIKPFLGRKGHAPEEVERMHAAWVKAVVLQAALWSYPYAKEGDW
ncbi:MAG: protoglobin domain-containing protein [Armatimonadetes bacterium]|nr:protoglobin domain-containing protein [Armatimonadota bacterium]MDW8153871.1 protoglobin domain-containing protein [Armatimonadota bacterium]